MLRRPMTRLATAVAVAGTVTALGAGAALAAPAATWHHPHAPVPGAFTTSTPALSSVTFPNPIGQGLMVAWRGVGVLGHIHYKYRTLATGHWSHEGTVPGTEALTGASPAIGSYIDPLGRHAVLAVWQGRANNLIWYSQGETLANGTIDWTTPASLPSTIRFSKTYSAPTVFFPEHSGNVVLAWRGEYNHVRYLVGTPAVRGFTWAQSFVVPGPPSTPPKVHCVTAPCTSDTPAVTEQTTSTSTGLIYVFWKQLGTTNMYYSTTVDGPGTNWSHLTWTGPTQVTGAKALTGPSASIPNVNGIGPVLLVYKSPFGTLLRYQTLSGGVWSAPAFVYGSRSDVAPALDKNVLAYTTVGSSGNIELRVYS